MKNEERIEVFMRLGLTMNQARVYLALARLGLTTAKRLSKDAQISRQDVYRVMSELQEIGLLRN
ncbi:MAG: helix-turn-helix domain-containing protein [Candidatus Bathyarchaeia archaeon]